MDYKIRIADVADIPIIRELMYRLAEFDLPPRRKPEHFWITDSKRLLSEFLLEQDTGQR